MKVVPDVFVTAYGVSLVLLGGIVVQSLLRNARARRALQAEEPRRG